MSLLSWAERLCAASAPTDVIDLHVRDTLAAAFAGLNTDDGRALACRYGARGHQADLAAGIAAIARLSECDDIHLASCITPGSVVIPVALALTSGRDVESFRGAVAAGYAAGLSLGLAIGGARALAAGVWPTLLSAPLMAAVTASRLQGHNPTELAHAMALALAGAGGRVGRPAGGGRWFTLAEAIAKGLRACEAASLGFRGDLSLLSPSWLAAQAGHDGVHASAFESLQPVSAVGFKPFPIARQALNAVLAFQCTLQKNIEPNQIESIEVFVPPMNVALLTRPVAEDDRLSRLCNMGFQLACAALVPDTLYDTQRAVTAPLMEFARRVSVVSANDLGKHLPHHWAARVVVKTRQEQFEETLIGTDFDAGAPNLAAMLRGKWGRLTVDATGLASGDPAELWQQIERHVTMAAQRES